MSEGKTKSRYFARIASLRIVMTPAYTKEVGGRVVTYPGHTLQFSNNYFETDEAEVIEYLDGNDMNDRIYWKLSIDENLDSVRKEKMEDLEAREARIKAREDELAEREARAQHGVNASPKEQIETEARRAELMALTRDQLTDVLKEKKLKVSFSGKEEAVERIITSEVKVVDESAREEGDGAKYE